MWNRGVLVFCKIKNKYWKTSDSFKALSSEISTERPELQWQLIKVIRSWCRWWLIVAEWKWVCCWTQACHFSVELCWWCSLPLFVVCLVSRELNLSLSLCSPPFPPLCVCLVPCLVVFLDCGGRRSTVGAQLPLPSGPSGRRRGFDGMKLVASLAFLFDFTFFSPSTTWFGYDSLRM